MRKLFAMIILIMMVISAMAQEMRLGVILTTKPQFEERCQFEVECHDGQQPKIKDYTERYQFIPEFRALMKQERDENWYYVNAFDVEGDYYLTIVYLFAQTGVDKHTKKPIYTMRKLTWRKYDAQLAAANARKAAAILRATSNLANTLGSDLNRISNIYRGE